MMATRAPGGFVAFEVMAEMRRQQARGPPSFGVQQHAPLHVRVPRPMQSALPAPSSAERQDSLESRESGEL